MESNWDKNISSFIQLANNHEVRMILVGSGAMGFYGLKSHTSDVHFWIADTSKNLNNIILVLKEMGADLPDFNIPILNRKQDISLKFSPTSPNLELIANFVADKSFSWAYDDSVETSSSQNSSIKWRVIALEDLIISKSKSQDPQDLLDLQALKQIIEE